MSQSDASVFTRSPDWWMATLGGEWERKGNRWRGTCPVCTGKLEIRAGGPGTFASCFGHECSQADIAQAVDPDGRKPAAPDPAWNAEVTMRRRAEAQKRAVDLEAVRKRYTDAEPATDIPEYLTAKGYDWMPSGSRVDSNGITLVPMYRPGGDIYGAQELSKPGKPFVYGSQAGGTHVVVAKRGMDRLYVAEGVATAMAVAEAIEGHDMDGTVIAAFNCGNLEQVAKDTRIKAPEAEIIIASDNDRWTKGNPGVTKARAAAKACDGKVAIPEFKKLKGEPNDFDDLRRREGLVEVRKWLDPKMAGQAVTEAWKVEPEPEPEAKARSQGRKPKPKATGQPGPPEPKRNGKAGKSGKICSFVDNQLMDLVSEDDIRRWIRDPRRGWFHAPLPDGETRPISWDWRRDHNAATLRCLLKFLAENTAAQREKSLRLKNATISGATAMIGAEVQFEPAWDSDPMIAGLPGGGVLDLKTGEARNAQRNEFVSRRLGVAPDPKVRCKRFLQFLEEMTGGDIEAVTWLRTWLGYVLTAYKHSHYSPFFYGVGNAGKSTIAGILAYVLGTYSTQIPQDALIQRRGSGNRHPEWMTLLDGTRLAVNPEIPQGGRLVENLYKDVTAEDMLSANKMRRNTTTFMPTAKLLLYGNSPPNMPGWDTGLKRRMVVIECHAAPEPDDALRDTLKAEAPGILAWMAEACAASYARFEAGEGWFPPELPESVRQHTDDLFADQDPLGNALKAVFEFTKDITDTLTAKEIRQEILTYYEDESLDKPPSATAIGLRLPLFKAVKVPKSRPVRWCRIRKRRDN